MQLSSVALLSTAAILTGLPAVISRAYRAGQIISGFSFTEKFGRAAYIVKARTQLLRDLGTSPQPLAAFLLNLGLETLLAERHSKTALLLQTSCHCRISWSIIPSSRLRNALAKIPPELHGVVSLASPVGEQRPLDSCGSSCRPRRRRVQVYCTLQALSST